MKKGKIELIFGSMFSGKSEELMRRLRRATIAGKKVQLFKPAVDTRHEENIKTHDGQVSMTAIVVTSAPEILMKVDADTTVVGIDEAQFFGESLPTVANALATLGCKVIVTGLDMFADGLPIEVMGQMACIADKVDKLNAVCLTCGADAYLSHRLPGTGTGETIDIGGADKYEALCRDCITFKE